MMEISFYRGHPPFRPPLRIDSIALSGLTFVSGIDAVVGLITTYMSTAPFTGSLAVGGADAASFKIVGSNLVTNGTVAAGTYSITLIATQATANNSPFTSPAFTITGTPGRNFVSLGLSNSTFTADGVNIVTVGNVLAVLNPASPASTATITLGGPDAPLFQLTNGGVLPCALQADATTSGGTYSITLTATQAGISGSPFPSGPLSIVGTSQVFSGLTLDNFTFTPTGSAVTVGNVVVTMSPASPATTATIALGGTNATSFQLTNGGVLPCAVQAKSSTSSGSYTIALTATQTGIGNSPFPSGNLGITGSAAAALSAEISFPGGVPTAQTLVYDIAAGTDMGNYVSPTAGFTQRCIRVRHASLANYFVDFRQDVSGGRIEVVFWNGECLGTVPTNTIRALPAYNAVVKSSGTPVADFLGVTTRGIAFHDWGTRWRFQSTVRPVIRTASQVFSEGWLPHMSAQAARVTGTNASTGQAWSGLSYTNVASGGSRIVPPAVSVPSTTTHDGVNGDGSPMLMTSPYVSGGCVYQPFMLDNGGNDEILGIESAGDRGATGPHKFFLTAWQGDWLIRGTATSLNTMIQQAEYFSSQAQSAFLPHQVDGGPVNQKANLTNYRTAIGLGIGLGLYDLRQGNTNTSRYYAAKGDEHSPQVFYLPYALTEDAYFIEGAQYWENFSIMAHAYHKLSSLQGNLSADSTGQTGKNGAFTCYPCPGFNGERVVGWGIGNVAKAWKMSPTSPPSWLLPKSYWAAVSSDYSQIVKKIRDAHPTDQFYTVFKMILPLPSGPQTFERAYTASAMGFADFIGLPVPTASGQSAPPTWYEQLDYFFDWFRATCDPAVASGWNTQEPLIHDIGNSGGHAFMSNQGGAPSGCVASTPGFPQIPGNNCVSTWAQLWTAAFPVMEQNSSGSPTGAYPSNPAPQGYIGPNNGNLTTIVTAAAIAKSRGIPGAAAVLDAINKMIDYSFPQPLAAQNIFFVQDGFDGT